MVKKVLGKGLSALIPLQKQKTEQDNSNNKNRSLPTEGEKILYINLKNLTPGRYQPRENFDPERLTELILSIKEKGVLQPVLVRKLSSSPDNSYEVIAGERRLRAAKHLGIKEIPCILKQASDIEALELALIENIQREQLNAIEEANAYNRFITEFNFTQEKIALIVGKDRSSVANTLRLLNLPKQIQKSIYDGKISIGHAKALLSIQNIQHQLYILNQIEIRGLSVRETEELVRRNKYAGLKKSGKKEKRLPKTKDPNVTSVEQELLHRLGTRVKIIGNYKKGKIQIDYYSDKELERLLTILKRK